jgi:hypothetical protein
VIPRRPGLKPKPRPALLSVRARLTPHAVGNETGVRLRRRTLAAVQAAYYLPTAVTPLLSRSAFERVTGRKTEWWLVLTVSALVGAVGAALATSVRGHPGTETAVLGAGAAAGMGLIDVVYVSRGRISPVYLVDAALQLPMAAAWVLSERDGLQVNP